MLTIIAEYSRFPFAMPCPNTSAGSVIKCLNQFFTLCGTPNYIHSDRGSAFLSQELKEFLTRRDVATSKTTPFIYPSGNGQCERYNGILDSYTARPENTTAGPHSVGTCDSQFPSLNSLATFNINQHHTTREILQFPTQVTIWRISPIVAHCSRKSDATPLCSTQ